MVSSWRWRSKLMSTSPTCSAIASVLPTSRALRRGLSLAQAAASPARPQNIVVCMCDCWLSSITSSNSSCAAWQVAERENGVTKIGERREPNIRILRARQEQLFAERGRLGEVALPKRAVSKVAFRLADAELISASYGELECFLHQSASTLEIPLDF